MRTKINYTRIDLIIFFILLTLLTSFLLYDKHVKEVRYFRLWERRLKADYKTVLANKKQMARMIFDKAINRPDIISVFREVHTAAPPARDGLRTPLYSLLEPEYHYLTRHHFDQLTLYLPDGSPFLTFPSPGPLIKSEEGKAAHLSSGLFFSGFKYLFPLSDMKKHIGSVEISLSFGAIQADLKRSYPAEYAFIIRKSVMLNANPGEHYEKSDLSGDFLRENPVPGSEMQVAIPESVIGEINHKIRSRIATPLSEFKAFSIGTSARGREYLISFIPVSGIGGQQAAYLISYMPDDTLRSFWQNFILTWMFITVLLVWVLLVHLRSVRQLRHSGDSLESVNERLAFQLNSQKDAERKYHEAETRFRAAGRVAQNALIMTDALGNITFWNHAAEKIFSHTHDAVLGKRFYDLLIPERYRQQARQEIDNLSDGAPEKFLENPTPFEFRALRKNKSEFPAEVMVLAIRVGEQYWGVASVRDISEYKDIRNQLDELSSHDELTRLYNRRHFMKLSGHEFARCRRYNRALSLMVIDVDKLGNINNTHGHAVGDHVLETLAEITRHSVRNIDIIARISGAELAIILPDTDLEMACVAAERFRDFVARTIVPAPDGEIRFTVSIGVATVEQSTHDMEGLIKDANVALAEARKNGGHNRVIACSGGECICCGVETD
ncbi:hypothetical protein DENIS_1769 [Desulfonema ishimotonii]|uniref:diguanylate cyclase n=1 Tax=Desulfonema ishimotonii TaxID=45657 RepID=A0A401FV24_9BACT|nr:sensor domain-containing diguanylate cyclase [Desulfonema ishimotonii]GBC60810.1 hypothetical protein DENIS_1769 [Desulfonema ishimotonii]